MSGSEGRTGGGGGGERWCRPGPDGGWRAQQTCADGANSAAEGPVPPAIIQGYTLLEAPEPSAKIEQQYAHQKVLHFVRHAEGHHNVAAGPYERGSEGYLQALSEFQWFDARLSPKGETQCAELREATRGLEHDLIVISPLTRTLQTATLAFANSSSAKAEGDGAAGADGGGVRGQKGVAWVAYEPIRERFGRNPCDNRRSIAELSAEFPHVDFSLVATDHDPNPCSPEFCGQVWMSEGILHSVHTHARARAHTHTCARSLLISPLLPFPSFPLPPQPPLPSPSPSLSSPPPPITRRRRRLPLHQRETYEEMPLLPSLSSASSTAPSISSTISSTASSSISAKPTRRWTSGS